MKLHKFFGATSRAVLDQIRQTLGPDAMILANRPTPDGIEITAAAGSSIAPVLAGRTPPEPDPRERRRSEAREAQEAAPAPVVRSTPSDGDTEGVKVLLSAAAQRNAPAPAATSATAPPRAATNPDAAAQAAAAQAAVAQAAAVQAAAVHADAAQAAPIAPTPPPPTVVFPPSAPALPPAAAAAATAMPVAPAAAMAAAPVAPIAAAPIAVAMPASAPAPTAADAAVDRALGGTAAPIESPLTARLMEEVAGMRAYVEEQFAQLAWNDSLKRAPLRAKLLRELLVAGYSATLAREVVGHLPDDFSAERGKQWLRGVLTRNLRCNGVEEEIIARGGIYALVGPTGVGKTTTTAKLAARCAVRYGASRLALLTTDSYRVGAHDQLRIYAKILGVAVHTISDRQDLQQALDSVRGKHLVLIDTVGIGQRDQRVVEQSALLAHPEVQRLLLLNAAAQAETLEEVVQSYARPGSDDARQTAGVIVSKVDEAGRMAAVLDTAIRHRLLVHYVTNGQRVPEDLAMPQAGYLVDRSFRAAAKPSPFSLREDELSLLAATMGAAHA